MTVTRPGPDIELCRQAHAKLDDLAARLTGADVRAASLLPGWTVGHVLTHLARNADSVVRRLEGARRSEVVDQYVGGFEGRARDIDTGAGRLRDELVADVRASSAALDDILAHFPDEAWSRLARGVGGNEQPVRVLPFQRAREVEVHLVDVGLGYSPADWPDELVTQWLPELLDHLPRRSDVKQLMAWTLGRGPAPDLDAY